MKHSFRSYKRTDNIVGVYEMRRPRLLVTSAELVHRIFVNDFKHFHDNEMPATVSLLFIQRRYIEFIYIRESKLLSLTLFCT